MVADLGVDGGWGSSAEAWIELAPEHATQKLLLDPVMLTEADDVSGLRILDLGCGEGRFSRLLAARGATTVGIDPIRRLLQAGREAGDSGQHSCRVTENAFLSLTRASILSLPTSV
jgi:2-polyprenyl-3-methyl-5-hydroxy-6-metoxy-1,4-benzoquinol methylase